MPLIPNRWAMLRLESAGPVVRWRYSDSFRRLRQISWDTRESKTKSVWPPPPGSDSASLLTDLIGRLTEGLPATRWGSQPDAVPVALFIQLPLNLPAVGSERELLFSQDLDPGRLQFVQLASSRQSRRTPFRLPLNIFAV